FTDANKLALAKDHTALVSWGDGSTSRGAVVADPKVAHTFNVLASHTYTAEGQDLPFTVTVNDTAGDTAALHSTIDVADATKKGVVSFTAVEQKLFAGVVARFTDANRFATAGDYRAIISWGDGTITSGVVQGQAGSFTVSGSHTYAVKGLFSVQVTISEDGGA